MQLRFHARGTGKRSITGEIRIIGQAARYIGRKHVVVDGVASQPATEEPHECDSETADGRRCKKLCRQGELWAADEATAAACGVEFVALDHSDGAWVPASPKPKRASYQTTKD